MASKHHTAEVYPDGVNEWRWRLIARNGKILADSGQGYRTQGEAESATQLVFGTTETIPVVLETRNRLGKRQPSRSLVLR